MWWPFQWLFIYILGGFTCIPVLIGLGIWYVMTYGSVPIGDDDPLKWIKSHRIHQHDRTVAGANESDGTPADLPKRGFSGYLTVRRHFRPNALNTSFLFGSSTDLSGAEVKDEDLDKDSDAGSVRDGKAGSTSSPAVTAPTVSQRLVGAYKQVRKTQATPPKELFYCVLKGTVLFLYDDDKQAECVAAISIEKYKVGMEKPDWGPGISPGASKAFDGKDGEMFGKRNACVLRLVEKEKAEGSSKKGLPAVTKGMGDIDGIAGAKEHQEELENAPWFFFTTRNIDMEDLYISLIQASAAHISYSDVFSFAGMKQLVDTIDAEPDPLSTRWLNALMGRVFLSLNQTRLVEEFIIKKIKLKLTKVQRPAWLGEIVINEVHVGKTPPIFHRPMLKDLTTTGAAAMEVGLKYRTDPNDENSCVRFIVSTHATIPLGYKEVKVNLMVEARLKTLEGNVLLRIKEPPSNRIWWGFTSPPKLEVEIKPVVQDRKLNLSVILNQLDGLLRRVIAESIVLPAMDDIAFFPTMGMDIRGGIFSSASKYQAAPAKETTSETPKAPEDIITSSEDPSSATAETPGLRKRLPTKSQTLDHRRASVDTDEPVVGIARVDTAPPSMAGAAPVPQKRTIAFEKWFAAPPPSSAGSATPRPDPAAATLTHRSSTPPASQPRPMSMTEQQISAAPVLPAKLIIPSSTASTSRDRTPSPRRNSDTPISIQSGASEAASPANSATTLTHASVGLDHSTAADTSVPIATSTALFSAVKQFRAGDKKALQDMTKTGMDGVKKGWMNFAAKRKGAPVVPADPPSPEHRPSRPVPYRPAEDERDAAAGVPIRATHGGENSRKSVDHRSLKERLDAAAHAQSTSPPQPTTPLSAGGRQRSDTASSKNSISTKPSLLASPSKSSVPTLSASSVPNVETQWASGSRTNTSGASSSGGLDNGNKERRQSSGSIGSIGAVAQPVSTQPGMGRSMVVPRVIKRPGEVTGLGSSSDGLVRRVSMGAEEVLQADGSGPTSGSGSSKDGRRVGGPSNDMRQAVNGATVGDGPDQSHYNLTSIPPSGALADAFKSEPASSTEDLAAAILADLSAPKRASSSTPLDQIANAGLKPDQPPRNIGASSPARFDARDDLASAIQADLAVPPVDNSSAQTVQVVNTRDIAGKPDSASSAAKRASLDMLVPRKAGQGDLADAIAADVAVPPVALQNSKADKDAEARGSTVEADASLEPVGGIGRLGSAVEEGDLHEHTAAGAMTPRSVAEDALRRLAERDGHARTVKGGPGTEV